ncbi:hypothetical protein Fot_42338 [Forsythia ovata]|uniref:Uncharacterized protein n=1 Tax=Forsythia ovata TaxID=205694 RepID=A0ABD1RLL6_9LAMI
MEVLRGTSSRKLLTEKLLHGCMYRSPKTEACTFMVGKGLDLEYFVEWGSLLSRFESEGLLNMLLFSNAGNDGATLMLLKMSAPLLFWHVEARVAHVSPQIN